jgi:pimeloyl-ACP methyl ester carboxylesterase
MRQAHRFHRVFIASFVVLGLLSIPSFANPTTTTAPTAAPSVSPFEAQILFPGSNTQHHLAARVRPPPGCDLLTLRAPDGTRITALFGKPLAPHPTSKHFTLLYFYGNGMCLATSLTVFNQFRNLGFSVIAPDYEGYGMSDGHPSEPGCYAAADASYNYLFTRPDIDPTRIVATGWSLGAAVAIDLATRKPLAGLAAFSAFTSINDMSHILAPNIPAGLLITSRFDNLAKIPSAPCPLFLAHGTLDPLVPPEMQSRLAQAAKSSVTLVHVDGAGHNDIFAVGGDSLYRQLNTFVNTLSPAKPQ